VAQTAAPIFLLLIVYNEYELGKGCWVV